MSEAQSYSVELGPFVIDDLSGIVTYLSDQGAGAEADHLITAFQQRIEALEQFPRRGNVPKELEGLQYAEVRQLAMPPYRIFYEIEGNLVTVLLMADGRRDLPALLTERIIESRKSSDQ